MRKRTRGTLLAVAVVAYCIGAIAQPATSTVPGAPLSPPRNAVPAPAPQPGMTPATAPAAPAKPAEAPPPGSSSAATAAPARGNLPAPAPQTGAAPPNHTADASTSVGAQAQPNTPPADASTSVGAQAQPNTPPAAPAIVGPPGVPSRFRPPKLGWDVNLEGAYGRYFPASESFGFARVRGGVLYSADPIFYALGLTYEWSNLEVATFGIQAEVMQIETGLWLQLGGLMDTHAHPGAMAAVGWSILGAELQLRKFDPNDYGFAALAKLRIPVTFIAQAF